jgi:hypothetical protein
MTGARSVGVTRHQDGGKNRRDDHDQRLVVDCRPVLGSCRGIATGTAGEAACACVVAVSPHARGMDGAHGLCQKRVAYVVTIGCAAIGANKVVEASSVRSHSKLEICTSVSCQTFLTGCQTETCKFVLQSLVRPKTLPDNFL